MDTSISTKEILEVPCPVCKAAPTAKCLSKKIGGMGGMNWIENPHSERIRVAILKKRKENNTTKEAA